MTYVQRLRIDNGAEHDDVLREVITLHVVN